MVCYAQTRNKKQETLTKLFALFAFIMIGFNVKSQCAINITNSTSCLITVDVIIHDNIPPNGCVPANICATYSTVSIPPNSTAPLSCTGCSNPCNVVVSLTDVGGNTFATPFSMDAIITTSNSWSGGAFPCLSGSMNHVTGSTFDFIIN